MPEINAEISYSSAIKARWHQSAPGRDVCRLEAEYLKMISCRLHGRFLLQFGAVGGDCAAPEFQGFRKVITLGSAMEHGVNLLAEPVRLPIESASVNAVYLPHVLEFAKDPHGLLREVDRILIADGRLLLALFNPWGLYGVRRLFSKKSLGYPWSGEYLGLHRVVDWMSLLGFEVEDIGRLAYRPPFRNPMLFDRLKWIESLGRGLWPRVCGVNMVLAVKREVPLSLIRPSWNRGRGFVASGGIAEPTTRNDNFV